MRPPWCRRPWSEFRDPCRHYPKEKLGLRSLPCSCSPCSLPILRVTCQNLESSSANIPCHAKSSFEGISKSPRHFVARLVRNKLSFPFRSLVQSICERPEGQQRSCQQLQWIWPVPQQQMLNRRQSPVPDRREKAILNSGDVCHTCAAFQVSGGSKARETGQFQIVGSIAYFSLWLVLTSCSIKGIFARP
ncbi:hypothetical protein SBA5_470053 [Candidatus Sulfotelmatomonas gaucii]|uniref:Uncharacterized protein n=1 Tax=Candidatus Sulfuritelmatomonas gaucii TaxID=2043161 RepID=A0A2N9LNX9_9BACT|nr:hypothetical protein SBA5_470053 [Candidatus Sulfotelmatomonas gaucii]